MSHCIISGIDKVYTPNNEKWSSTWHGLESHPDKKPTVILPDGSNVPDVFCPIMSCGLKADFEAEMADVPQELKEDLGENFMAEWKLIFADCRNGVAKSCIPLHVPKKGYFVHQNSKLFACMIAAATKVLGQDGFEIVTVGTLGGYSQFFVSLAIKGQESFNVGRLKGKNTWDKWNKFFNLVSSHNGLIASNRMLSLVRIVCLNTVLASIADADASGTIACIKHVESSESLLTPEQFEKDLTAWIEQADSFQKALAALKEQSMSLDGFKAFAAGVFTNEGSDNLSTNSYNRVEEMAVLFAKGQGNKGETVYDGINAFTEYFTSGNGVGGKLVKQNRRVASANFGRGNEWKQQAILTATNEEAFKSAIERGTKLYNDKLTANAAAVKVTNN